MPVCRKCGRNIATKSVSCNTCGCDFHEGCLARFVGTKSCKGCCQKLYKLLTSPVDPPAQPSRSERESIFDSARDLGAASLLDISDLSNLSHSSEHSAGFNSTLLLANQRDIRHSYQTPSTSTMSTRPQNWNSLTVDDKLGELFNLITLGNSELVSKIDLIASKVENHETRIKELEEANASQAKEIANLKERKSKGTKYAEIKLSGIPVSCTVDPSDIFNSILVKLDMASDIGDVRNIREIVSRPQPNVDASQGQSQRRPATRIFCIRFKSNCVRDDVLQAKRAYGPLKIGDLYQGGGDSLIEMHEMLSPFLHNLRLAVKARAKACGYKHVWARDDCILARKSDGSEIISIITYNDLERII